jgi:hypothetical protein
VLLCAAIAPLSLGSALGFVPHRCRIMPVGSLFKPVLVSPKAKEAAVAVERGLSQHLHRLPRSLEPGSSPNLMKPKVCCSCPSCTPGLALTQSAALVGRARAASKLARASSYTRPHPRRSWRLNKDRPLNCVHGRRISRLNLRLLGGHVPHLAPAGETAEGTRSFVRRHAIHHLLGALLAPTAAGNKTWMGSGSGSSVTASAGE